ncbi:Hyaluronan/mRNA-binding protein [Aphelenchoides avenae]|nr:Hyaluronan/mRNA-binding protein [Aphelenchus avenae]
MVEYGINTSNKFAFLDSGDEDNDPAEVLKKAELARKQKAAEPKAKKVAAPPPAPVQPVKNDKQANKENQDIQRRGGPRKDQGPRGGGGPRGPRREEGDGAGDKMADRFGESRPAGGNRRPPGSGGRDDRPPREGTNFGGGRGRGGGRGGGFNRSDNRDAAPRSDDHWGSENQQAERREGGGPPSRGRGRGRGGAGPRLDRHSGSDKTGVKSVDKKEGHGKHNWGDNQDAQLGETEQLPVVNEEQNKTSENAEKPAWGDNDEAKTEQQEPEEEKPKELTLEEWKAQHKTEKPTFNVRKPEDNIYKKLVPLKRDTDDEDQIIEEIIYVKEKEKREKPLNIEVNFGDSGRNRGGGERGGRGGYHRGGDRDERPPRREGGGGPPRGGGGPRGGGPGPSGGRRGPQHQLDLNSPDAFPALGAR